MSFSVLEENHTTKYITRQGIVEAKRQKKNTRWSRPAKEHKEKQYDVGPLYIHSAILKKRKKMKFSMNQPVMTERVYNKYSTFTRAYACWFKRSINLRTAKDNLCKLKEWKTDLLQNLAQPNGY